MSGEKITRGLHEAIETQRSYRVAGAVLGIHKAWIDNQDRPFASVLKEAAEVIRQTYSETDEPSQQQASVEPETGSES